MCNLNNPEGKTKFKDATMASNNGAFLSSVFDDYEDLDTATEIFLKRLQKTIKKCFNKIRVTDKVDKEKEEKFSRWKELKRLKNNPKELENIEKELADEYGKEYMEKIADVTKDIDDHDAGMKPGTLWEIKKSLCPKSRDPPTAMIDPQSGNLLTSEEKIEEASLGVYCVQNDINMSTAF